MAGTKPDGGLRRTGAPARRAGFTTEEIFNLTKMPGGFWCRSKKSWILKKNSPPPRTDGRSTLNHELSTNFVSGAVQRDRGFRGGAGEGEELIS
jgi:hypothetical protein